jgi:hypothetical protein
MLAAAIARGLTELEDWGRDVGRAFDPGAITVETKRIANGLISVSVTGDLRNPEPPMDRPESPYANERVPHVAEEVRSVDVRIEVDTNKDTYRAEFHGLPVEETQRQVNEFFDDLMGP